MQSGAVEHENARPAAVVQPLSTMSSSTSLNTRLLANTIHALRGQPVRCADFARGGIAVPEPRRLHPRCPLQSATGGGLVIPTALLGRRRLRRRLCETVPRRRIQLTGSSRGARPLVRSQNANMSVESGGLHTIGRKPSLDYFKLTFVYCVPLKCGALLVAILVHPIVVVVFRGGGLPCHAYLVYYCTTTYPHLAVRH